MSLLTLAEPVATRLKAYIYGEAGTGKTITALSFPSPAVVDAEDGTVHYGKYKKFFRVRTSDTSTIKAVIDELIDDPQGIKTFVVDPFTAVYEALLVKHENRLKVKTGNPNYALQPSDYKAIKSEIKGLIIKLLSLDMNVIVTARSATDYAKEGFMQVVGTKADGPKELPYMFDVVLELAITPEGKRIANVKKDRTNTLPPTFEFNYQAFTEFMGIEGLEREPIVINQKAALDQKAGRSTIVSFNGVELKTAGVTAANLLKLQELASEYGEEKLQAKLREDYMIDSLLDLKDDEAMLLIKDITANING